MREGSGNVADVVSGFNKLLCADLLQLSYPDVEDACKFFEPAFRPRYISRASFAEWSGQNSFKMVIIVIF